MNVVNAPLPGISTREHGNLCKQHEADILWRIMLSVRERPSSSARRDSRALWFRSNNLELEGCRTQNALNRYKMQACRGRAWRTGALYSIHNMTMSDTGHPSYYIRLEAGAGINAYWSMPKTTCLLPLTVTQTLALAVIASRYCTRRIGGCMGRDSEL